MPRRALRLLLPLLGLCLGAGLLLPANARGDAESELTKVQKQGRRLWVRQWARGGKTCASCHESGPNRMIRKRLDAWPKYDKVLKKVATGQEKINDMIVRHALGKPLPLGSPELTALEAYIKTR